MASSEVTAFHRNVVVIGKSGAGKSTVANHLIGEGVFKVAGSLEGTTEKISHGEAEIKRGDKKYHLKVVDTIGLSDPELKDEEVIEIIKNYFRNIFPSGISLVLFVFNKGRFTAEERVCLETIIKTFRQDISPIAGLVVTRCEGMKPESRDKYVEGFRSNELTCKIAAFMEKGIFPVGFPDTGDMEEEEVAFVKKKIDADAARLRDLVCSSGEMRLGKQLFQDEWWGKFQPEKTQEKTPEKTQEETPEKTQEETPEKTQEETPKKTWCTLL